MLHDDNNKAPPRAAYDPHLMPNANYVCMLSQGVTPDHAWVTDLAKQLGNAMDVAEGQCGGCTRQVRQILPP